MLAFLAVVAMGCSSTEPQLRPQADVTVLAPGAIRSYRSDSVVWGLFPGYAFNKQVEIRLPSDIGVPHYVSPRLYLLVVCGAAPCADDQPRSFSVGAESTATAWLDTRYGFVGDSLLPVTFGADSGTITPSTSGEWTRGAFDVWVAELHLQGTYTAAIGSPASWWPPTTAVR
jgi:hypothetical protein